MINRLNEMRHEPRRILRSRKMPKTWHGLVLSTWNFVRGLLRHFGRVRPVVLPYSVLALVSAQYAHSTAVIPVSIYTGQL
jgi:hypothetical protein